MYPRHSQLTHDVWFFVRFEFLFTHCFLFWYAVVWFGCRQLVRLHSPDSLTVYVAKEGVLYRDQIEVLCLHHKRTEISPSPVRKRSVESGGDDDTDNDNTVRNDVDENWRPLLILIPVRLGIDKLNCDYVEALRMLLHMKECLGIVGGKPKQSLYFVGCQGTPYGLW